MANAFAYRALPTPVHRLDARAKVLGVLAYSIALLVVPGWTGMAVLAGAFAVCTWLGRLPLAQAARQLAPLAVIMAFTLLAPACSIDGGFHMVPAGLALGALNVARIALLLGASLLLTFTTAPEQLARALTSLLSPLARLGVPVHDIGLAVSLVMRFIPLSADELSRTRAALACRGAQVDGTLRQRAHAWGVLFTCLFVALYRRAAAVARAMDARCYGASDLR